ncbi:MAG: hypothetical protein H7Y04_04195 [Verrucomicrobia bacterium]|nr:hypothetical protein [Cytophagales bacterium]
MENFTKNTGKNYALAIDVTTVPRDPEVSIPKRTIKITPEAGKVFYESSQMDIFK